MRQLTAKQKKLLDKNLKYRNVDELPSEVWEELERINDTEILYQEVNRYLNDHYEPFNYTNWR